MKGKMFANDNILLTRKTTFKLVSKYVVDFVLSVELEANLQRKQSFISCPKVEIWLKGCSHGAIVTVIFYRNKLII